MRYSGRQYPRVLRLLAGLWKDSSGNTLAMIAAALVPVLAMVGGGIDMGRSYLSQTRLQQACDAGVLAARKKLGSAVVTTGVVPADVATVGDRFFNLNFGDGSYGTTNRGFEMTLEQDFSISGSARVDVPTTIMNLFGYRSVDVTVNCQARLNFSNTDIMFVLDTTGSMNETNPDDTKPRIAVLRDVVKNFYAQIDGSKSPDTRVRYGFVPYSTNVNVGGLLRSDWLVDTWTYHGRSAEAGHPGGWLETVTPVSGNWNWISVYQSDTCPADTATWTDLTYVENPDGSIDARKQANGDDFWCEQADGAGFRVGGTHYGNYVFDYHGEPDDHAWRYQTKTVDVTGIKNANPALPPTIWSSVTRPWGGGPANPQPLSATFQGCIEERATYEISDWDNVDLNRARDLDIDSVPVAGRPETQWRPMLHEFSFARSHYWDGTGAFTPGDAIYHWDYFNSYWGGFSACPSPARKLSTMTAAEISSYVDGLVAQGSTYHDIGMIWGGRLLSPAGLFAAENADEPNKPTRRNLIFLTDGETAPLDISYGSYGIEPLDQRRWSESSGISLTETVERRFGVACAEVKKRDVTVWVIGFGTSLNPIMTECAGPGHYFEAANAADLEDIFAKIAAEMGDLRISR